MCYKITSRDATKPYMKVVDSSYLGSSDEVRFLPDFEPIGKVSFASPLFLLFIFSGSSVMKGCATHGAC